MKKKILLLLLVLYLILVAVQVRAAGPWKGKIIDIETKKPIDGAVVVAYWQRAWRTPAGNVSDVYEVKEVLTDRNGNFEIPSYTPINLLPILSYIKGPEFIIFKPGHLSLSGIDFNEYFLKGANKSPIERQEWRLGKTFRISLGIIELPKLKTKEERRMAKPGPVGEDSDYKKQKLFIKLIREEWEFLTGEPAGDLYQINGGK